MKLVHLLLLVKSFVLNLSWLFAKFFLP